MAVKVLTVGSGVATPAMNRMDSYALERRHTPRSKPGTISPIGSILLFIAAKRE